MTYGSSGTTSGRSSIGATPPADLLVGADRLDHRGLVERAGAIDVVHVEHRAGLRKELARELGVRLGRRALAALALDGQLFEALREAAVDRDLPLVHVDLARAVLVQHLEGLLEARRVQQEL